MPWGPDDWDAWTTRSPAASVRPPLEDEMLRDTLAKLPGRKTMTVADLGCGAGDLLPFLAEKFGRVIALDYAPRTLARARQACRGLGVEFRRRDLRDLTPLKNSLDVAVAVDSILGPRPADVDRVLVQIHASLVEGGLLIATFPAVPRVGAPVPVSLEGLDDPDEGSSRPLAFTEAELQYRLRRAEFRGLRIRRFPSRDGAPDGLVCLAVRRAAN